MSGRPTTASSTARSHGSDDVETVRRQAARSLSLDHDGRGWAAVGERDPVLGALQARYDWLRPVCFYSAYEAATSFVIGQRIAMRQARVVKDRLAAEHGDPIEIGGEVVRPFPRPQRLLDIHDVQGISAVKVAACATSPGPPSTASSTPSGCAHSPRTRHWPSSALPGVGPWTAQAILMRGCGVADSLPLADEISRTAVASLYGLARAARRRDLDRDVRRVAPVPDVGDGPAPHGLAPRPAGHAELPPGRARPARPRVRPRAAGPRPGPPRDDGRAATAPACAAGSTAGSPRPARRRR